MPGMSRRRTKAEKAKNLEFFLEQLLSEGEIRSIYGKLGLDPHVTEVEDIIRAAEKEREEAETNALRAGVFKNRLSPHKLRHTFATLLHSNDVDILEIQALLGHASITSTQIYTHTSSDRLRTAVDKLDSI